MKNAIQTLCNAIFDDILPRRSKCLVIYTCDTLHILMLIGACISVEKISEFAHGETILRMSQIDSTYLLLESAVGRLSCKYPPVPKEWNCIDRPHVALIQPYSHGIHRVLLSESMCSESGHCRLWVRDLNTLKQGSVVEIKHSAYHITYYRREVSYWTKIAEATDPFFLYVFSHGLIPVELELHELYSE